MVVANFGYQKRRTTLAYLVPAYRNGLHTLLFFEDPNHPTNLINHRHNIKTLKLRGLLRGVKQHTDFWVRVHGNTDCHRKINCVGLQDPTV